MDMLSEIEIEALAVETQGFDQTVETVVSEDIATLETDLQTHLDALVTFLDGSQSFDPYGVEWLADAANTDLAINSDAANWLTAFIQDGASDVIIADDINIVETNTPTLDKPTINHTEEIDQVMITGVRIAPWSMEAIQMLSDLIDSWGTYALGSGDAPGDVPERWRVQPQPPGTPTDGVQVDRDGLTIPDNQDTEEQEATEDLIADIWNVTWVMNNGDPTVEWGSEYNENTQRYHVFQLPLGVG